MLKPTEVRLLVGVQQFAADSMLICSGIEPMLNCVREKEKPMLGRAGVFGEA